MTSSRYRTAIIGCGRIARAHANGYAKNDRYELAACSDIATAAAEQFAGEFGIPSVFADYREMLDRIRPDVVSICTHHHLHAEMAIAAAAYRPKAIYCEKPMAMHLNEADEMIRVCREQGVLLLIGHQRRYSAQYQKAKELLDEGRIGALTLMESYGHPWSSLFIDGTHSIDLLRYYNDDRAIDWVMGQVDTKGGSHRFGHPNEGASLAMLHFQGGVRAVVTTGGFSPSRSVFPAEDAEGLGAPVPPNGYHKLALHGTEGRLEIDGDDIVRGETLLRIHRGKEVESIPVDLNLRDGLSPALAHMAVCLDTGESHLCSAEAGRAALEALSAIFQSSKERTIVYLPGASERNAMYELLPDQKP